MDTNEIKAKMIKLEEYSSVAEEMKDKILKMAHGRSEFQMSQFVINTHDTPERKYSQAVTEMRHCLNEIRRNYISMVRAMREIERIKSKKEGDWDLDIMEQQIIVDESEVQVVKKGREIKTLKKIIDSFPDYTWDDVEVKEAEYWEKRLARQLMQDKLSRESGTNPGQIEAMLTANMEPVIDGLERIESYNIPKLNLEGGKE